MTTDLLTKIILPFLKVRMFEIIHGNISKIEFIRTSLISPIAP